MSLRDDLLPLIHSVRGIPGDLGLRPYTVDIVVGTWSGDYTGRGSVDTETVRLAEGNGQNPKVRTPNDEELALGNLARGEFVVGPVTPSNGTIGTALADLIPSLHNGQTRHAIVTGPGHENGTMMRVREVKTDRALHYMLTLSPVEPVPE